MPLTLQRVAQTLKLPLAASPTSAVPSSPQHEDESEAHQIFRSVAGHSPVHRKKSTLVAQLDDGALRDGDGDDDGAPEPTPGIAPPGSTGVIYVMDRAMAQGFTYEAHDWANFGQGAPEVGPIPGATPKPATIDLAALGDAVHEYAPTTGVKELRQAVARLYNETYRQNKASKYTHENVCIVPGGRAGLTRVASVVGDVYAGYQIPEYTAYDQMLSVFRRLVPIPTALSSADGYKLNIQKLKESVQDMGLTVVFASNPRNPTGQAIEGEDLEELVKMGQQGQTIVLDEFYSWYNLEAVGTDREGESLSAAKYIDNVNKDAVVLIDGVTKNWRLPGWRCCWVIGPKALIAALSQSGSFLDGGANHPLQVAVIPLLDLARVHQDKVALQRHFRKKRDYVLDRLEKTGLKVAIPPKWTFYIWLDLEQLPAPINAGLVFMEECLKEKTIVVPGLFFDINPSHRRNLFTSPTHHFVRLSFGPPMDQLEKGLDGIQRVLDKARNQMDVSGHLNEMGTNLVKHVTKAATHGVADRSPRWMMTRDRSE